MSRSNLIRLLLNDESGRLTLLIFDIKNHGFSEWLDPRNKERKKFLFLFFVVEDMLPRND